MFAQLYADDIIVFSNIPNLVAGNTHFE